MKCRYYIALIVLQLLISISPAFSENDLYDEYYYNGTDLKFLNYLGQENVIPFEGKLLKDADKDLVHAFKLFYVDYDRSTAIKEFKLMAKKGNPLAQLFLGRLYHIGVYYKGIELKKSVKKARELFGKAAAKGYPVAYYYLAITGSELRLLTGRENFKLILTAAELGHEEAQALVAMAYHYGAGVEKDDVQYFKWLSMALAGGSNIARTAKVDIGDENLEVEIDGVMTKRIMLSAIEALSLIRQSFGWYEQGLREKVYKSFMAYKSDENADNVIPPHSLESLILNERLIDYMLGSQGLLAPLSGQEKHYDKHKNDYDKVTISDVYKLFKKKEISGVNVYLLHLDKYSVKAEDAISVSFNKLWENISSGDTVLLSDGVTHHYCKIYKVSLKDETISFVDAWPDEFFLKHGLNMYGIDAKMIPVKYGRRIYQIRKDEFAKVVVGVIAKRGAELGQFK